MNARLGGFSSLLGSIAWMFGRGSSEALEEYRSSRGFTKLHEVLLGISNTSETLEEHLLRLAGAGMVENFIDMRDLQGRTALAWAVECGWIDSVKRPLKFGADPHQRMTFKSAETPLLHLVIAGPTSAYSHTMQYP